jgi:hypothetical protein
MYNPLTMPRRVRTTALDDVKRRVTPGEIEDRVAKTARIVFQLAPAEKRDIQEFASRLGLTVTDYFLNLHRMTKSIAAKRFLSHGRAASSGGKAPKSVVKGRADLN